MKNKIWKDVVVLIVLLAIIFVICLFLPQQLPFHINAQGKVDFYANKYFLLFVTIIPYSVYWRYFRK